MQKSKQHHLLLDGFALLLCAPRIFILDVTLDAVLLMVELHVSFLESYPVLVQGIVELALEVPPFDRMERSNKPYSVEFSLHVFDFAALLILGRVYPPHFLPKSEAL